MSVTLTPRMLVMFRLSISAVKLPLNRAVQFKSFKIDVKLNFINASMSVTLTPRIVVIFNLFISAENEPSR